MARAPPGLRMIGIEPVDKDQLLLFHPSCYGRELPDRMVNKAAL